MRILCGTILAVAVAAVGAGAECVEKVAADFALVRDGAAVARFEFGAMPDEKMKAAAEKDVALFNRHLKEVTGCELETVASGTQATERTKGTIKIDLKPIDRLDTRFEWKIEFPDNGVMRVEATRTSLFTALRQLLEEGCDARFLGAENCMFQFEPRKDVVLEVRERRSAASNFSLNRSIYRVAGHWRELGLTEDKLFEYSHGIPIYAFPAGKYGADKWPEEIMPVLDGKKIKCPPNINNPFDSWQPCYSNPRTGEIAVENIREILRKKPGKLSVTLGVNDLCCFCECERCKAMLAGVDRGPFTNVKTNSSEPYYTFVNRVADALEGEFPDLTIGLLAYTDVTMPPSFKLNRHVVPMVAIDTGCSAMDAKVFKTHCDLLRTWGERARTIGIWDYCWGWLGGSGYVLPRVDFEGQAAKLKTLYAAGGRAYFGEDEVADSMDGPKLYLTSRLLEDADADSEAILSEWFTRLAGKAAEKPLREIYRRCREHWRSPEMRRSPIWPARNYIYAAPEYMHLFAVKPGFTEGLLALAREVREAAVTPGEKARADVILRHIERLDCLVAFRGVAYAEPENGELADAAAAARMLENFADRADDIVGEWDRVMGYFRDDPDFDEKDVYRKRETKGLDAIAPLTEMMGRVAPFTGDPRVAKALERVAAAKRLPPQIAKLARNMLSGDMENRFSNIGFAKGVEAMKITTTLRHEIVDDAKSGGKVLRIWPGQFKGESNPGDFALRHVSGFKLAEDLPAGIWLATMTVRTESNGKKCCLSVWPQLDGVAQGWENYHPTTLRAGVSHTLAQVREVRDTSDGLVFVLNLTGFGKDDSICIEKVSVVRVGDALQSGRAATCETKTLRLQKGSKLETVRGEEAVVNRTPEAGQVVHVPVRMPRILPDEKLEFTIRAALPEGAKTGRLTAGVYEMIPGMPGRGTLFAHRLLSAKGYEDIVCSVKGSQLGKKSGKYLVIVFKDKGTDAVAVSRASWKVTP